MQPINRMLFTNGKHKRIMSTCLQYLVIVLAGIGGALMLLHGLDALFY